MVFSSWVFQLKFCMHCYLSRTVLSSCFSPALFDWFEIYSNLNFFFFFLSFSEPWNRLRPVVTQYTERVCPSGSLTMQAVVETLMSFGLRHVVEFDGKITCKL